MFDFTHLSEIVTDPTDISLVAPRDKENQLDTRNASMSSEVSTIPKRKKFVEITRNTPLSALSRFFEWNSAAVVTERGLDGTLLPIGVVTKVDLLTWVVKRKKHQEQNGNALCIRAT
jgi:cystathionine beta-synthase